MLLSSIILASILFFNTLYENPKDSAIFISPVRIPLQLSANFGELRLDHFHTGIDIKTQGVSGKEVVAAASGYIYRISVSPGGFGKAIYIKHQSGYSTVYGHLSTFAPEIEKWVISHQYEKKSFLVNLFPTKDRFPVIQGDIIAFSGNSGSSAGPHLHYEVRKSDIEIPINPLGFEFGIEDNIKPVIEKLVIYPGNQKTLINNNNNNLKLKVSGGQGNYFISAENVITINGIAGFGVKSFDLLNNSNSKCGLYSLELIIDSVPRFSYVMDSFSFNETRYINSHIDYEHYLKEKSFIERTFVLPNDKLSIYNDIVDRGLFNFNDERVHFIEIYLTDYHKNKSSLKFKVKGTQKKPPHFKENVDTGLIIMPYNKTNRFRSENVSLIIPSGSLYDTLYFNYKKTKGAKEMLSDLHAIHNKYTPVHKPYMLYIKPTINLPDKKSKMLIVQLDDDEVKKPLPSSWSEDYMKAEAPNFGNFYIGIDTVPPLIQANGLSPGINLTGKKEIRIKITDDLSGIKSYEGTIDEKWALFEYDQKNNILVYRFDEKRITSGTKHALSIKVIDNKDNISYFIREFIW